MLRELLLWLLQVALLLLRQRRRRRWRRCRRRVLVLHLVVMRRGRRLLPESRPRGGRAIEAAKGRSEAKSGVAKAGHGLLLLLLLLLRRRRRRLLLLLQQLLLLMPHAWLQALLWLLLLVDTKPALAEQRVVSLVLLLLRSVVRLWLIGLLLLQSGAGQQLRLRLMLLGWVSLALLLEACCRIQGEVGRQRRHSVHATDGRPWRCYALC